MDESAVYNQADLAPFRRRLAELRQIVQHEAQGKHANALTKLLERQLNECGERSRLLYSILALTHAPDATLQMLSDSLAVLSVELLPIHERLVTIRRQLVALAAKEGPHKAELKPLQEELRRIDGCVGVLPLPPKLTLTENPHYLYQYQIENASTASSSSGPGAPSRPRKRCARACLRSASISRR
jgi:hypothetical protein